jgi:hypothetical protein
LEAQNQKEITDLAMAIAMFKQSFGIDCVPSRIDLSSGDQWSEFQMSQLFPQGLRPGAALNSCWPAG